MFIRKNRTMIKAMPCVLLLGLLSACGGGSSTSSPPSTPPTSSNQTPPSSIAASSLTRNVAPQATAADIASAVTGNTTFAINALRQFDPTGGTNIVFSPYSITQAMAMMAAGAKGNTLSGIQQALSFSLPPSQLNPALNAVDLQLAAKTTTAAADGAAQYPSLNIVNDVWAQNGFSILPSYLDTMAVNFGGNVRLLDFVGVPENSRNSINSYIAQQTNNRIQDLIIKGAISSDTRLVLTNAIWFKGAWQSKFSPSTGNLPFTGYAGGQSAVPFMQQKSSFQYAQTNDYQAVDLPYVGGNLSMLVVMPTAGTFNKFLSDLTADKLGEIARNLSPQRVDLSMPKFKLDAVPPLNSTLPKLGMIDAFDTSKADFSGIDGKQDLHIDTVVHKAFIAVDENGTEAAAATGITVSTLSATAPPQVSFLVDHPFLFILRDRSTGLILFMGKVVSLT